MSLSARTLVVRIVATPVIGVAASLLGAISNPWWLAAFMGFMGALLFTAISERILRRVLMGKIGKDPLGWYVVHLIGETLTLGVIGWLFGVAIAGATTFWIMAGITWLFLCWEMISSIFRLLPLWLATRGGPKN